MIRVGGGVLVSESEVGGLTSSQQRCEGKGLGVGASAWEWRLVPSLMVLSLRQNWHCLCCGNNQGAGSRGLGVFFRAGSPNAEVHSQRPPPIRDHRSD